MFVLIFIIVITREKLYELTEINKVRRELPQE